MTEPEPWRPWRGLPGFSGTNVKVHQDGRQLCLLLQFALGQVRWRKQNLKEESTYSSKQKYSTSQDTAAPPEFGTKQVLACPEGAAAAGHSRRHAAWRLRSNITRSRRRSSHVLQ